MMRRRSILGGLVAMSMPTWGGNPPMRPDQLAQAGLSRAGSGPSPASPFVVARRVVINGPAGGLFVYTGTPAAGNLIASISATAGTDPYGNAYPAGIFEQTPGSVSTLLANGALNLGSAAAGTRVTVDGQAILSDALAVNIAPAMLVSSPQTAENTLARILLQGTSQDNTAGAGIVASVIGPGLTASPFFTVQGDLSQQAMSTTAGGSQSNFAAETQIDSWTIPANDPAVSSTYAFSCFGSVSTKAATTPTLTLRLRVGSTAGALLLTTGGIVTAPAGLSNASWALDGKLQFTGIGAGGVVAAQGNWQTTKYSAGSVVGDVSRGAAIATNASMTIVLTAQWSAADPANILSVIVGGPMVRLSH